MSPGKAFAVIAKRTGGPAGMAVSAVWKGRDTLAKILIVIISSWHFYTYASFSDFR